MASGGPSFGFLCCRKALVRQMPGRRGGPHPWTWTAGRDTPSRCRPGSSISGAARPPSNICTNQGLLVTAATHPHGASGRPPGLAQVACDCRKNTRELVDRLTRIPGVATPLRYALLSRVCRGSAGTRANRSSKPLIERGACSAASRSGDYFPGHGRFAAGLRHGKKDRSGHPGLMPGALEEVLA